jgi:hypothetical protein
LPIVNDWCCSFAAYAMTTNPTILLVLAQALALKKRGVI